MSEEQKKALQQQLWNIADTLRGKMHADEFRDYILGFIFYKYLSEKMLIRANRLLKTEDVKDYTKINENSSEGKEMLQHIKENTVPDIGYFLKPSELFSYLAKKWNSLSSKEESNFILWDLTKVLANIQNSTMGTESEDDFNDLFSDLDLTSQKLGKTEDQKNELIAKVLSHLDKIDFQLEDINADVLGDAYEYLIGQFASSAGKKAGEFYTPQEVSKVLAKIVTGGKKKIKSVYDPTCGSGSLLLRVAREVEVVDFYGQEMNRTTYNLARMNMILHGVQYRHFNIEQEDTLEHPQHRGEKFEAIVANPPFSAQWRATPEKMSDDRFSQYGVLAPSSKADFAFVQHMIHHLDDHGTMAIILPHGALFRGWAEQVIRKYLIAGEGRNYLDAIIWLPANLFYGTSIPACIMVFKKCRENPENILFIDASNEFEKAKKQNVLRPQDIEKIISTYLRRKEIEKYSHIAPLSEIEKNDYNLNISRYVSTCEEEKPINIEEIATQILALEQEMKPLDKKIQSYCAELGIKSPF
jgi:type I restriction enzyme M protein